MYKMNWTAGDVNSQKTKLIYSEDFGHLGMVPNRTQEDLEGTIFEILTKSEIWTFLIFLFLTVKIKKIGDGPFLTGPARSPLYYLWGQSAK